MITVQDILTHRYADWVLVQRGTLAVAFSCGQSDTSPTGVDDRFSECDSTNRGTLAGCTQKLGLLIMNSTTVCGPWPEASQPSDKLNGYSGDTKLDFDYYYYIICVQT